MILNKKRLSGNIQVPPSKSDGQRAVLAAANAKGESIIKGLGPSDDEQQMLRNVEELGAQVVSESDFYKVRGWNSFPKHKDFSLGESGLGFRLVAGLCAVKGGEFTLRGEGTLPTRPMHFFQEQFADTGLKVEGEKVPLKFSGYSDKRNFKLDGSQGSQFLSGLLMALPSCAEDSVLYVENLKSKPYVDMTIAVMNAFGVQVENKDYQEFRIKGGQEYQAISYRVESDWSSASCWLAASACGHDIHLSGLSMQSLQADKAMLDALVAANCQVTVNNGQISIDGSKLQAFEFDANDCPDLFPALAVLAARATGISKIKGLNRLAIKESDRGKAIQQEWKKLGVRVDLDRSNDTMIIHGGTVLKGAKLSAHQDHRMAMSLGIMSTFCEETCELQGAKSVGKSYPDFWTHFVHLAK